MATIDLPRVPQVIFFHPFRTKIRFATNAYIDDGTFSDIGFIVSHLDGTTIVNTTTGYGTQNVTYSNLNLLAGEVYYVRARHKNETGWSGWSAPYKSRVASDIDDYSAITVSAEPASGGAVPIDPDFSEIARERAIIERKMQTGHIFRRPRDTKERWTDRMVWSNQSDAELATIRNFLNARADAAESFTTSDDYHGSRTWFINQGRIESIMEDVGTWTVIAEVVEILTARKFTIGVSAIGGPDPIA